MTASTRRKHKSVARKFLCVLMVDAQLFGSRSRPRGTADQASLDKDRRQKRVCPWITGRDRVVILAHPRAPARRRVGGLEWRRLFGSRRLGDPAHGSEARRLGQAQKRVRGNGLSCGRYGGRPSGNRIGCRLLEAHVDERMTSALEALDPADPTIGTRARSGCGRNYPRGWRIE